MDKLAVEKLAAHLAKRVGERMREVLFSREQVEIHQKGKNDLVTEIDFWAEQLITDEVKEFFPEHLVLGEEFSAKRLQDTDQSFERTSSKGVVWVVDPVDGTANFASRIPHCVVSIGVLKDGVRELGVVYDPFLDELFEASAGKGATLNGAKIEIGSKAEISQAVVATGFPAGISESWSKYLIAHEAFLTNCHKVRILGAAALEQCWVACGRLDGYFQYGLKPWDVAAGSLIVEEAGGMVGPFDREWPSEFTLFDSSLLAANPSLFPKMKNLATEK